jgi:phage gp46-like protein
MFDVATLPQPNTADPSAVFGVPFDWRIAQPAPTSPYPFSDYSNPYVGPSSYVDKLQTYSVALEGTLNTAVILSLFTDRRASEDDALPRGQTDRRGWVGESFLSDAFDSNVDAWGSALWLLSGKVTSDVLEQARFAAQEALAWLVRDGLASRIEVTAQWVGERGDRLALRPTIYEGTSSLPVYDVLWATSVRRWVS